MTDKFEETIQRLSDILTYRAYFKEKFVFNTSDYKIRYPSPIYLNPNRNHVVYLKRIAVYNTIANIDETNNVFTYSPTGSAPWKTIKIDTGSYEIKQLNALIQDQMKNNNDYDSVNSKYYISIVADEPTSKVIMTISNATYKVDFTVPFSMNTILGFDSQIYSTGVNKSQNVMKITFTNDIDIYCNLVTCNSHVNGVPMPIIYSISAYSVAIGAKVIISEINPIYLPLATKVIDVITFQLKDDNGKLVNFSGETIIIELVIQQI